MDSVQNFVAVFLALLPIVLFFGSDDFLRPDFSSIATYMLPISCFMLIVVVLGASLAYLYRQNRHLRDIHERQQGQLQSKITQANTKILALSILNKHKDRNTCEALQQLTQLQAHISNMHCAHGIMDISPSGWITHTCCQEVGSLKRKNHMKGLQVRQLQSELRSQRPRIVLDSETRLAWVEQFGSSLTFVKDMWPLLLRKAWSTTHQIAQESTNHPLLQETITKIATTISQTRPNVDFSKDRLVVNLQETIDNLRSTQSTLHGRLSEQDSNIEPLKHEQGALRAKLNKAQSDNKELRQQVDQQGWRAKQLLSENSDLRVDLGTQKKSLLSQKTTSAFTEVTTLSSKFGIKYSTISCCSPTNKSSSSVGEGYSESFVSSLEEEIARLKKVNNEQNSNNKTLQMKYNNVQSELDEAQSRLADLVDLNEALQVANEQLHVKEEELAELRRQQAMDTRWQISSSETRGQIEGVAQVTGVQFSNINTLLQAMISQLHRDRSELEIIGSISGLAIAHGIGQEVHNRFIVMEARIADLETNYISRSDAERQAAAALSARVDTINKGWEQTYEDQVSLVSRREDDLQIANNQKDAIVVQRDDLLSQKSLLQGRVNSLEEGIRKTQEDLDHNKNIVERLGATNRAIDGMLNGAKIEVRGTDLESRMSSLLQAYSVLKRHETRFNQMGRASDRYLREAQPFLESYRVPIVTALDALHALTRQLESIQQTLNTANAPTRLNDTAPRLSVPQRLQELLNQHQTKTEPTIDPTQAATILDLTEQNQKLNHQRAEIVAVLNDEKVKNHIKGVRLSVANRVKEGFEEKKKQKLAGIWTELDKANISIRGVLAPYPETYDTLTRVKQALVDRNTFHGWWQEALAASHGRVGTTGGGSRLQG